MSLVEPRVLWQLLEVSFRQSPELGFSRVLPAVASTGLDLTLLLGCSNRLHPSRVWVYNSLTLRSHRNGDSSDGHSDDHRSLDVYQ